MWLEPDAKIHSPEIGRIWINSAPLNLQQLHGRVVLVDFWDYTCVNCLRTLPYLSEWHRRYSDKGLTIAGIHTPEFSFARTPQLVEAAVRRLGVEYAVALDNEYQIWQAFANRCWPAKYLIDKDGYVRYVHLGEGSYGETEEGIQKLLLEVDPKLTFPKPLEPLREADVPGARCYPATPELYLGFGRGTIGNASGYSENQVLDYLPGDLAQPDTVYLGGPWFADREYIEACPLDGKASRIALQYAAAEVNLVMSPPHGGEGVAHVFENGKPLAPEVFGEDIIEKDGKAGFAITEPRMYRLIKNRAFATRTLEIVTSTPGLGAYALTFGSCLMES